MFFFMFPLKITQKCAYNQRKLVLFFIFLAIRGALSSSRGNADYRRTESDHNSGNSEYNGEYVKMGYSSGVPVDNEEKPSKEGFHSKWTPIGDAFTLKEICDETGMFNYDDILGDEAELIGIEFADGSSTLRIAIPLKDGAKKELKAGIGIQKYYEEGDKVKVNLIYGQELHKIGQPNIVRYDVWESEEQKIDYLRKRDGEDPSTEVSEVENLSTEVTEEDLANAWRDEFGVLYSADRKRLLRAPRDINEYSVREGTKVICDGNISKTNISNIQNRRVITKIGEGAFCKCDVLKSISFPQSLVKVGESAFRYCKSLQHIVFPDSVIEIGDRAFCDCTSLVKFYFPKSISKIGDWTFRDCKHLKEIKTGNSVVEIGKYAFGGCHELCSVTLPKSLVYIRDEAFRNCKTLSYIQIPSSTTMIGYASFSGCENLNGIEIPKSLSYIGKDAFDSCTSLKSINLPVSVNKIESGTFSSCKSLFQINIPSTVTEISDYAFSNCEALSIIDIPNSVTSIGNGAFDNCYSLSHILIPDSVRKIGNYAFSRCKSLCNINIPDSVTEIGTNPFLKCERIEIDCNFSINGVLYSSDFTRLISYVAKGNSSFNIPDSVSDIENSAFYGIGSLTQIIIPNSVKRIGRDAFRGCWSLKTIEIPKSVNIIEDAAFYGCEKLAEVVVLNSDLHIDKWAFKFCNNKLIIRIPFGTKEKFENMLPASFKDKLVEQDEDLSTNVTDQDLANAWTDECGVKYSIDRKRLLRAPKKIESYRIGEGTKVICDNAFSQCKDLQSVIIPGSVTTIGDFAFYNCGRLSFAKVPKSVKNMGMCVFEGCERIPHYHPFE